MILGALSDAGGQKYLLKQAKENPAAFMTLIGKVLPKDIALTGANGGPIRAITQIQLVPFGHDSDTDPAP